MATAGGSTHAVVDGSLGFALHVPQEWSIRDARDTKCVWNTPSLDAVVVEQLPAGFVADEAMLDVLRDDVRKASAEQRGGLVECEIVPGLGAFAVSKRPAAGPYGVDYVGLAQIPTSRGRASIIVYAREGSPTGMREAVCFRPAPGDDPFVGWFADPYGEPLPAVPTGERWARACKSDARELDAKFPDHPLSRVRAVLELFRAASVTPPAPADRRPAQHDMSGVRCELPLGFLPMAGAQMRDGQVYVRDGFEARRDHLSICRQPDFPEAGRSVAGARAMIDKHVEWSRQELFETPRVEVTSFEGRNAIRAKWTASMPTAAGQRRMCVDALYMPWGADSLEVSCGFEIDSAARTERALKHVVASLRSAEP